MSFIGAFPMPLLEIVGTFLAIGGMCVQLYNPKAVCISWYIWLFGDIIWAYIGYEKQLYGLVLVNVIYFIITVWGIYRYDSK